MRKAPLVPVALAMIAGIVVARHIAIATTTWLWCLAGCATATGITLLISKRLHAVSLVLTVLFCGLVGGLLSTIKLQHDWTRGCPEKAFLEVRLTETPMPREKSWRAKAAVLSGGDITLFLRKDSTAATLRYGDRLLLHGYPDTERRIIYITENHYIVTGRDSTSLRARCESLRLKLLHRMQAGPLKQREAGIAEALTLGWRGDLEPTTQASFRDAGIAHLLAVSGLHVGLLAAIVGGLFVWAGKERRGRFIRGSVQLAAIWAFALLTGLAPSTVRAALMFSLFIVAHISGRRTPALNLLATAAIALLLCRCRHLSRTSRHHGVQQPSVATHRGEHFRHHSHATCGGHYFSSTTRLFSHRQYRHCAAGWCTAVSLTRLHGVTLRGDCLSVILVDTFL